MKGKLKRLLCGALSAAVIISSLPAVVFADEGGGASAPPLMKVTFDETESPQYTLEGGASLADGRDGKALSLDGNNQYAAITGAADTFAQMEGDFAISIWAKPSSVDLWARIFDFGNSDGTNGTEYMFLTASNGSVTRFAVKGKDKVEQFVDAGSAISANEWHNIVIERESGVTALYIDGFKAGESTSLTCNFKDLGTISNFYLGKSQFAPDKYFNGMIDDFALYGRALSESEIRAIAAEAYTREAQKRIEQYNNLIIETHFYDNATNAEIYQYTDTQTVKAVTEIKNYVNKAAEFTVKPGLGNEQTISLPAGGESTYKTTFAGSDADSFNITITDNNNNSYDAGTISKGTVVFPGATPDDTFGTTYAAHDPSIFKDPKTGVYYAYNSGNALSGGEYELPDGGTAVDTYPIDTFTSTDLIHWTRIDNNFRIPATMTAYMNEIFVPKGSNANTDAWAPDIFYAEEDTEHPYWLYYSLSTNGSEENTGKNLDYIRSAIGLVKGSSPVGPWTDCGVIISSDEDYNTNAIDSNIYEDKNGDRFFIWGSFQKGIHQVKLTADGKADGVDYTSNATIHSSSKNVGTRLFSTPDGIEGPEGPYMIDNAEAGYRYMFTSYGDLAVNYNIRIARNSLDNTWASETSGKDPHHKLLDHQGRKVGTTFTEQADKTVLWGYKMLGSYQLGDGLTYYGNGHNSVLHDDDGSWYLVEHCRKQSGGYAVLQVRKMLWTKEGWPVVSPLVYAGEDEQVIPREMLYGTWDLSSVGQTILGNGATTINDFSHRADVDMPVRSTEVVLCKDGKLGNDLGTWEYDDNHTVTLHFTKDGNKDNYEFYRNGDTMTLFVLTGYDKDQHKSAIVMTGTDQNSIANFAKKNNAAAIDASQTSDQPEPITIEKSAGGNPILGFDADGGTLYAGDPAAFVDGDTVYIIAGHDTATNESYVMPEWVAYSSKDMKTWEYKGSIMKCTDISWRNGDNDAWASQMIKYKDKYYLYYCTFTKNDSARASIGVATATSPTGPFVDSGKPLITGSLTTPETHGWDDIDPTVYVETVDGVEHRYLCWGNTRFYTCELNEDMVSVKNLGGTADIEMGTDIKEQSITGAPLGFTEAPWIYRQKDAQGNPTGKYYLFYAMGMREQMAYATADTLIKDDGTLNSEWQYGGLLMPPSATANTNHPAVIDFNGHTYFIYHNGALPWGSGFRRSVCVEEFTINEDGTIDPIQETSTGLTGTASRITQGDSYIVHENFVNSGADGDYPISKSVSVGTSIADELDTEWEILPGKADPANEHYVSIQSVNKPGLYLAANDDNSVVLTQDSKQNDTAMGSNMTFRTMPALNESEDGVSFESVAKRGYYLTNSNGALVLTTGADADAATFNVSKADETPIAGMLATVTDAWHNDADGFRFRLNNAVIYGNVDIYAAEYAKDTNMLLGVGVKKDAAVTSMKQSMQLDYTRKAADSTLKLFVWKDMEPVAEVTTVTETENPYQVPTGYTSYYDFEDNLTDSVTNTTAVTVGWDESLENGQRITDAKSPTASYADGYKGKALAMTGSGSDGVNLGKVITNGKYTVAFRMKANAFTFATSGIFINSGTGASENWVSAPFGSLSDGNAAFWSNVAAASPDHVQSAGGKFLAGTWHHVALAADGGTASMYIDGVKVVDKGTVINTVSENTDTYLGVNYWDTPFNGLIDDLYIYNGTTLTDAQITSLYEATNK